MTRLESASHTKLFVLSITNIPTVAKRVYRRVTDAALAAFDVKLLGLVLMVIKDIACHQMIYVLVDSKDLKILTENDSSYASTETRK